MHMVYELVQSDSTPASAFAGAGGLQSNKNNTTKPSRPTIITNPCNKTKQTKQKNNNPTDAAALRAPAAAAGRLPRIGGAAQAARGRLMSGGAEG
jgi:hypothetical protein